MLVLITGQLLGIKGDAQQEEEEEDEEAGHTEDGWMELRIGRTVWGFGEERTLKSERPCRVM